MRHLRSISIRPAKAQDALFVFSLFGSITGAFVAIYGSIWLSKNWESIFGR